MEDYYYLCQVCGYLFSEEDYEEYPLEKGHCSFCNHSHLKKIKLLPRYNELSSAEVVFFLRPFYQEFENNPYYDQELCYQRRLQEWSIYKHGDDIYYEDELIERSRELSLWESWFKSKERKALEEKYPEDITPEKAPQPYYLSLEPYETDDEEEEEEEEIEVPKPKYIPRCPTCGSPDVHNRGSVSLSGEIGLGRVVYKQYVCKNCGYEW